MLFEMGCQINEEMFLSINVLGYNAEHVDIPIVAIGFQFIASEDFQAIAEFLKIDIVNIAGDSNLFHPLINYFL